MAYCVPLLLSAQGRDASAAYGEGIRAYYAEDYKHALASFDEAIAIKPDMSFYLYNRALAHLKLNHDSLADVDLRKMLRLDSNYLDAWYQRGMIAMSGKSYDSAFGYFLHALKLSNSDVKSLHQLGVLYYYRRQNREAVDIYTKIISIDSTDTQAYYKRGLAQMNAGQFVKALADFSLAFHFDPEYTVAIDQRATCYMRMNDMESACRDWQLLKSKNYPHAGKNITRYCTKE
jgi:tetratricopeptide (TPR) repeat protein